MKHVIITQARNESIRLENWMAYHSDQGINALIFFDDFSTDTTKKMLIENATTYNIDLDILDTDGQGEIFETGNSETYGYSASCNFRILRSFSRGLELAKLKYGECICYLIDIDEFMASDLDTKISDIVENIMENRSIKRIYCHSFDIDNRYELNNWITNQPQACYRWNYASRNQTIFKTRGKSICKSSYIDGPLPHRGGVVHDLGKDVTDDENYMIYSQLRMHHYRIPPLLDPHVPISFVEDKTIYNKTLKFQ